MGSDENTKEERFVCAVKMLMVPKVLVAREREKELKFFLGRVEVSACCLINKTPPPRSINRTLAKHLQTKVTRTTTTTTTIPLFR